MGRRRPRAGWARACWALLLLAGLARLPAAGSQESPDAASPEAEGPPVIPIVFSGIKQSFVAVAWEEPAEKEGDVVGYKVEWGETEAEEVFANGKTMGGNVNSMDFSGLASNTTYSFKVEAITTTGATYTSVRTVRTVPRASPPGNVTVSRAFQEQLRLAWDPPRATYNFSIVTYIINFKHVNESGVSAVEWNSTNTGTWWPNGTVAELEAGEKYRMQLTAVTTSGPSFPSEIVSFRTVPLPAAPVRVRLLDVAKEAVTISWEAPQMAFHGLTPHGSSVIEQYRVRWTADASYANLPGGSMATGSLATRATFSGLRGGTIYGVEVAAVTDTGVGAYSVPANFTTCTGSYFSSGGADQGVVYGQPLYSEADLVDAFPVVWLGNPKSIGFVDPFRGGFRSCPSGNTVRATHTAGPFYRWSIPLDERYVPRKTDTVVFTASVMPAEEGSTELLIISSVGLRLFSVTFANGTAWAVNHLGETSDKVEFRLETWLAVAIECDNERRRSQFCPEGLDGEAPCYGMGRVSIDGKLTQRIPCALEGEDELQQVTAVGLRIVAVTGYDELLEEYSHHPFHRASAWVDSLSFKTSASKRYNLQQDFEYDETGLHVLEAQKGVQYGEYAWQIKYSTASMTAPRNCPDLAHSEQTWDLVRKPDLSELTTLNVSDPLNRSVVLADHIERTYAHENLTSVMTELDDVAAAVRIGSFAIPAPEANKKYAVPPDLQSEWTDTGYGTLSLVLDRPGTYEVSLEAQGVCPNEYFLSKVAVEAKCNAEPAIDVEVFEVFHSYLTTCFPEVHFNGVASSDGDGDSLTFWWSIIGVPERSRGQTLVYRRFPHAIAIPDYLGEYTARVIASDGCSMSSSTIVGTATWAPACTTMGAVGNFIIFSVIIALFWINLHFVAKMDYKGCNPHHPFSILADVNAVQANTSIVKDQQEQTAKYLMERRRTLRQSQFYRASALAGWLSVFGRRGSMINQQLGKTLQSIVRRVSNLGMRKSQAGLEELAGDEDEEAFTFTSFFSFYVGSVYDRLLARVNNFRPKRLVAWISVLIELPWGLCVAFPDFQPFGLACKSSFLPVFLTGSGGTGEETGTVFLGVVAISSVVLFLKGVPLYLSTFRVVRLLLGRLWALLAEWCTRKEEDDMEEEVKVRRELEAFFGPNAPEKSKFRLAVERRARRWCEAVEYAVAYCLLHVIFFAGLSVMRCISDNQLNPVLHNGKQPALKCYNSFHLLMTGGAAAILIFWIWKSLTILTAIPPDNWHRHLPHCAPLQVMAKLATCSTLLHVEVLAALIRGEVDTFGSSFRSTEWVLVHDLCAASFTFILLCQHLAWQSLKGSTHYISSVRAAIYGFLFAGAAAQLVIHLQKGYDMGRELRCGEVTADTQIAIVASLGAAGVAVLLNLLSMRRCLLPMKIGIDLIDHKQARIRIIAFFTLYRSLSKDGQSLQNLDKHAHEDAIWQLQVMARVLNFERRIVATSPNIVQAVFHTLGDKVVGLHKEVNANPKKYSTIQKPTLQTRVRSAVASLLFRFRPAASYQLSEHNAIARKYCKKRTAEVVETLSVILESDSNDIKLGVLQAMNRITADAVATYTTMGTRSSAEVEEGDNPMAHSSVATAKKKKHVIFVAARMVYVSVLRFGLGVIVEKPPRRVYILDQILKLGFSPSDQIIMDSLQVLSNLLDQYKATGSAGQNGPHGEAARRQRAQAAPAHAHHRPGLQIQTPAVEVLDRGGDRFLIAAAVRLDSKVRQLASGIMSRVCSNEVLAPLVIKTMRRVIANFEDFDDSKFREERGGSRFVGQTLDFLAKCLQSPLMMLHMSREYIAELLLLVRHHADVDVCLRGLEVVRLCLHQPNTLHMALEVGVIQVLHDKFHNEHEPSTVRQLANTMLMELEAYQESSQALVDYRVITSKEYTDEEASKGRKMAVQELQKSVEQITTRNLSKAQSRVHVLYQRAKAKGETGLAASEFGQENDSPQRNGSPVALPSARRAPPSTPKQARAAWNQFSTRRGVETYQSPTFSPTGGYSKPLRTPDQVFTEIAARDAKRNERNLKHLRVPPNASFLPGQTPKKWDEGSVVSSTLSTARTDSARTTARTERDLREFFNRDL